MIARSLLYIALTSAILATGLLPVFAQSQRYPTPGEMQRLRILFRQQIRATQNNEVRAGYIQDRRSRAEVQNRESFVRNWSRVEPALAPFLGIWSGYEETLHIYPSNIRGRACIVITGEGHGSFTTGSIYNGQIRYSNQEVLFIEGNYMGIATVENNKPSIQVEIPLNSPTPLVAIAQLRESMEPSEYSIIRQQFNTAGCTASLPNRRR
jgi:hypothetical protein